jgi:hypothetical protein
LFANVLEFLSIFEILTYNNGTIPIHGVCDISWHAFAEFCPFVGRPGFQAPILHYPENISTDLLLLNKEYAWHIGGGFSQHDVQEWKLLYHSSLHGQSFNTFLGKVT